jgi:hypothetical protein
MIMIVIQFDIIDNWNDHDFKTPTLIQTPERFLQRIYSILAETCLKAQ